MYFLNWLCRFRTVPKHLTDVNLKTDISWVRRLTASNPQHTEDFVNQLTFHNAIQYDEVFRLEIDSKYCNYFNDYMRAKDST